MGLAVEASQTQQTIADYTNVVNSVVQNAVNQSAATTAAFNQLDINLGEPPCLIGATIVGNVNINQTTNVTSNLSAVNTNSFSTNIRNNLQTQTENWINNNLQANQGWLAFAVGVATANNVSVTQIANDLANSVSDDVLNQCRSEIDEGNRGVVQFCGYIGGDFNVTQSAAVTNITSCINNNVFRTVLNNQVIDNIIQQTNNKFLISQQGIWGFLRWIVLIVVAIGIIAVIGLLLYFAFGGSSKPKVARPEGEAEKLCILETEEQGARLPAAEKKALFQRCVIRKEEERFGGERREGQGPQRFGEGEGKI